MTTVFQEMRIIMGDEIFTPLATFTTFFLLNFGYIHGGGIKKLDAYFENGKDYDDTWSLGANFRYFGYCGQFILGKLKVEDHGMRWRMYFNALGYALLSFYMICVILLACYLKISSWLI